jgi:hypothetical protein
MGRPSGGSVMRSAWFSAILATCLAGCATPGPKTAWGKPGVTPYVYVTDIGLCSGLAAQQGAGNGMNTAGGISGHNSSPPTESPGRSTQRTVSGEPPPASAAASSVSLPAGGTYSGTVSSDYAQRAATQQRAQEMLAKRAQAEVFRSCITDRGYKEFTLSPQQRQHLATLREGSSEYLQYLHKLGSDPAVVDSR